MWQPIETAPRNQTFLAVLNCAGEQTICTMRWPVAEAKNSRPDSKTFHVERVTHWMPLPDLPGAQAQPAPTQSTKDDIISDLQSQFDTEGITEYDSGDALIRLSDAIAAVEDNFALAQPAPSVPDGWQLVPSAESRHPGIYKMLGALHAADNTPGISEWESYQAMLAQAPKPETKS